VRVRAHGPLSNFDTHFLSLLPFPSPPILTLSHSLLLHFPFLLFLYIEEKGEREKEEEEGKVREERMMEGLYRGREGKGRRERECQNKTRVRGMDPYWPGKSECNFFKF